MTWSLHYESAPFVGSISDASNPEISFWYYFYDTFLPSIGWTTASSTFSASQTYFLTKKEVVQADGSTMKWCLIFEHEWSSYDLNIHSMPWNTTAPDITGSIGYTGISSQFDAWKGTGKQLQLWVSDQNSTCFLIKDRDPTGSIWAFHFPDSWYYSNPAVKPGYDTSNAPVIYLYSTLMAFDDVSGRPSINAYSLYSSLAPYYPEQAYIEEYLTDYIQMRIGDFGRLYGAQNDMLWRNPRKSTITINKWQAITYKGENYIDAGYNNSVGVMFKTGSINPITGA